MTRLAAVLSACVGAAALVVARALSPQTMRPLALALCLSASALAQPVADRPVPDRAAVLAAVAVPLGTAGALLGYADGLVNEWAWCVDRQGRGGECLALNGRWHTAAAGGRALVLVAAASGLAVGSAAELTAGEAALVGLSSSMAAALAFDVGHNVQQGQPYWYKGVVAPTDQMARGVGPRTVFWVSSAATAAVVALTVYALR